MAKRDYHGRAAGRRPVRRHRVIALCAAALFFVMPCVGALALDTLKGIQPPALTTTLPDVHAPAVRVTSVGTIKKQGMTSYMYGTHVLVDENGRTLYALKSDRIGLDPYAGKRVTVSGELVQGYPVDNGPDYLDVISVREEGPRNRR